MQHEFDVAFHSHGVRLAGRFIRSTDESSLRQPTVVVTGSWLTVKEQMPLVYARRLADAGFTAFIFDFAGFGESDGAPRQREMPARKIVDITSAADFVRAMSFVGKVGHLAICASAQYALAALARGAPIDSYACVAGWYHDAASVAPFYGGKEGVDRRMAYAHEASRKFSQTGEQSLVPAYEAGNDRAGMFFPLDYYARAERGAVPSGRTKWMKRAGVTGSRSMACRPARGCQRRHCWFIRMAACSLITLGRSIGSLPVQRSWCGPRVHRWTSMTYLYASIARCGRCCPGLIER